MTTNKRTWSQVSSTVGPIKLQGRSGRVTVGHGTGGNHALTGSWSIQSAAVQWPVADWFSFTEDPTVKPHDGSPIVYANMQPADTVAGVLERMNQDYIMAGYRKDKLAGVLIHGLTWHLIKRDWQTNAMGSLNDDELWDLPVRVTWQIPEWTWIWAYQPPKPQPVKQPIAYTAPVRPGRDAKSNTIKARGRR